MKKTSMIMMTAAACLALRATADAAVTYSYLAENSNYSALAAGAPVTVNLYLQETLTDGSQSVVSANGLFSAGFRVARLTAGPAASTLTDISGNSAFAGGFVPDAMNDQTMQRGANAAGPAQTSGPGFDPVTHRLWLGTVTIQPGTVNTTFRVGAAEPNFGGYTTTIDPAPFGYDLDRSNNGNAPGSPLYTGGVSSTFTVTVPEPASLSLLALGATVMLWRRR